MQSTVARRPISMKDVAEHLGISKATVSRALSGKSEIPVETREKINQACELLGYRLNKNIQDLILKSRNGNTRNIGFVLVARDFSDPVYASLTDGVAEGIEKFNYNLMLVRLSGKERNVFDFPPLLRDRHIDAVLVAGDVSVSVINAFKKLDIEIMVLGIFSPALLKGVSNIQTDIEKLAYESVELAINAGCRKIAMFEEAPKLFFNHQVHNYIKAAAEEYSIEFLDRNFYQGKGAYSGARDIMKPVFKEEKLSFDCIICWDYRAAEELAALVMGRCGLDAEPDLKIVVSRPHPHFRLSIPALYLDGNNRKVALTGVEYLIKRLENNSKKTEPIQIKI
jgi:DNA-binding LacI/PurR family transcriptional regulator